MQQSGQCGHGVGSVDMEWAVWTWSGQCGVDSVDKDSVHTVPSVYLLMFVVILSKRPLDSPPQKIKTCEDETRKRKRTNSGRHLDVR